MYPEIECRGQFGDSFGAVNALFAGLAFAGVIYAIILQKKELGLQRDELGLQRRELEYTRAEIRGQKEQLQAQNQTLQKQNFENSFFQLLSRHNEIVNSMAIPSIGDRYSGRECFDPMLHELQHKVSEMEVAKMLSDTDETKRSLYKLANKIYEEFSSRLHPYVGHYFQHLYNVVKFIDQSDQDIVEQKFYTDLLRAQLSSTELELLFYHGLSDRGAEFKILVEKYSLFEGMPSDAPLKYLYDPKAYKPD